MDKEEIMNQMEECEQEFSKLTVLGMLSQLAELIDQNMEFNMELMDAVSAHLPEEFSKDAMQMMKIRTQKSQQWLQNWDKVYKTIEEYEAQKENDDG